MIINDASCSVWYCSDISDTFAKFINRMFNIATIVNFGITVVILASCVCECACVRVYRKPSATSNRLILFDLSAATHQTDQLIVSPRLLGFPGAQSGQFCRLEV